MKLKDLSYKDCENLINYVFKSYGRKNLIRVDPETTKSALVPIVELNVHEASRGRTLFTSVSAVSTNHTLKLVFSLPYDKLPMHLEAPIDSSNFIRSALWSTLVKFRLEYGV